MPGTRPISFPQPERGPEADLREAIELYGRAVFGTALRLIKDYSIAEEVAQDTFLSLWMRPESFDPDRGNLGCYLHGVAKHKAVDRIRLEEPRRRRTVSVIEYDRVDESSADGIQNVERREGVKTALQALTQLQRQAILLIYFGGRTCREAAEELEVPVGTIKTRLHDGLVKLRGLVPPSPEPLA
jgi:RNA polymerase sigma-70 factor (ECF subfamily)